MANLERRGRTVTASNISAHFESTRKNRTLTMIVLFSVLLILQFSSFLTPSSSSMQSGDAIMLSSFGQLGVWQFAHAQLPTFAPSSSQDSAACAKVSSLEFKGESQPGFPSFIFTAGQEITVGVNLLIPEFSIFVMTEQQGSKNGKQLDLDILGTVEAESVPPGLRISGASVSVDHGEAVFSNMMVQTTPTENTTYKIRFTAFLYYANGDSSITTTTTTAAPLTTADPSSSSASGPTSNTIRAYLETGNLIFQDVNALTTNTLASAKFGYYGYFNHAASARTQKVPTGSEMPPFDVRPLNVFGHVISDLDIQIVVTCDEGTLSPNTFRGVGQTTISGMKLNVSRPGVESATFFFNVRATATGAEVSFISGTIAPETGSVTLRNFLMLFTPNSLFSQNNIGNTAVLGVSMPVIEIALYDSKMAADTSNTGLIITATCAQTTLVGAEALVVKGVAQFKNLAFSAAVAPRSAVITFTAGSQGSLPIDNAVLYSGTVAVTSSAIKARHMQLSSTYSFLRNGIGGLLPLSLLSKPVSGQASDKTITAMTHEFTIPSIVIEMKDSAFQFDQTATNMTFEVSFDPPQGLTVIRDTRDGSNRYESTASASIAIPVVNGVATMSNLKIATDGRSGRSFMIRISDPLDIRSPISTGVYTLHPATLTGAPLINDINTNCRTVATATSCHYHLQFGPSDRSFIYSEDVKLDATVGVSIPEVAVYLIDRFGNQVVQADPSLVPQLYAYTTQSIGGVGTSERSSVEIEAASALSNEGSANIGTWRGDHYIFTCLQFATQPNGLARVYFGMREASTLSFYRGVPDIRSGFFSVTSGPESRYSMAFAPNSFIQYPHKPLSAVVNVALPSVVIVIRDSSGLTDDGSSDVEVIATANGGSLDSDNARVRSSNGIVTFSLLRFTSLSDTPTITFRAVLPGKPVDGRTLTTGPITLTQRPIDHYAIAFSEPYVEDPTPVSAAALTDPKSLVPHNHKALYFNTLAMIDLSMFISLRSSAHQDEIMSFDYYGGDIAAALKSSARGQYVAFQLVSDQVRLSDNRITYVIGEGGHLAVEALTGGAFTASPGTIPSYAPTTATVQTTQIAARHMDVADANLTSSEEATTTTPASTSSETTTPLSSSQTPSAVSTTTAPTTVPPLTSTAPPAATTTLPTTTASTTTSAPVSNDFVITYTPYIRINNIKVAGITRPSEPIFIKVLIVASSSPTTTFSELSIGPISFTGASATCAGRNNKPTVVLELATPSDTFQANNLSFRADLAYTMGIEDDRVAFSNLRLAKGEDFRAVNPWKGVKVNVQFDDPSRTSTNRKTSRELAEELITIDTYCRAKEQIAQGLEASPLSSVKPNEVTPSLKAAYFLSNDRSCLVDQFYQGLNKSNVCNLKGEISTCECYLENVVAEHGISCVQEPAIADDFLQMCKLLSTCRSTDITNVCEEVLASYKKSWWWVWLVMAAAGVVLLGIVVVLWYFIIFKRQPTVTLNADKN